jgi:hypothetical protein
MDDSKDRESQHNQVELMSAVFGAAVGWGASVLTDPAGGVVVSAAAAQAVKMAVERVSGHRGRQITAMWEVAVQAAGQTHDELLARVIADPHRRQLFAAAVQAAADTALQAKLDAIGRRLAMGVTAADDGIEVQRVIIETLRDLELPHWQALRQITKDYEGYGKPVDAATGRRLIHGWTMEALRDHLPSLAPIIGGVIPVLEGQGLIVNTAIGDLDYGPGAASWIITDYGRDCLAALEQRGREDSG